MTPLQLVKPAPRTLVKLANDENVAPDVTLSDEPTPALPVTCNAKSGEVVPIPTFPATAKPKEGNVGVVEAVHPIPTLPVADSIPSVVTFPVRVEAPVTAKVDESVVAPDTAKVPDKDTESFRETVTDPPKDTSPPPVRFVPAETVILELSSSELDIFWPSNDTSPVASGKVIVLAEPAGVQVKVPVGPPDWKTS